LQGAGFSFIRLNNIQLYFIRHDFVNHLSVNEHIGSFYVWTVVQ
jgi:hypothetical protein